MTHREYPLDCGCTPDVGCSECDPAPKRTTMATRFDRVDDPFDFTPERWEIEFEKNREAF